MRPLFQNNPHLKRAYRHAWALWEHGTPAKLRNLLLVEAERLQRKTRLSGYPYVLIIEATNACNLKCALCPTGMNLITRPRRRLRFSEYKFILDRVGEYALEVSLHNWGEPFLNADIFDIIDYTRSRGIGTNVSTNLTTLGAGDIDNIIRCGLEYLSVSLDGTSEDVYRIYRVGGDFYRVMSNLEALIARKRELRSRTPLIEWQFIVMRHNEHQMGEARRLARRLGVDLLRFINVGLPFDASNQKELARKWFPADARYRYYDPEAADRISYLHQGACFYLYRSMTINPDGGVAPCCVVYDPKYDFGNILSQELADIWNNEHYRFSRALFSRRDDLQGQSPCQSCKLFRKRTADFKTPQGVEAKVDLRRPFCSDR